MNRTREPLIVRVPTSINLMYQSIWEGLTKRQREFLARADECTPPHPHATRHDFEGLGARGAALRVVSRLERMSLVQYVGHGRIEGDCNGDAERPIYAITDKGRTVLRAALSESKEGP